MTKANIASSALALGALALATTAAAASERFFETKESFGAYDVKLHVMEVSTGAMHGREHRGHNLQLNVTRNGAPLGAETLQAEIVHPNLQRETVTLELMDGVYMASTPLNCIEGWHTISVDLGKGKPATLYYF